MGVAWLGFIFPNIYNFGSDANHNFAETNALAALTKVPGWGIVQIAIFIGALEYQRFQSSSPMLLQETSVLARVDSILLASSTLKRNTLTSSFRKWNTVDWLCLPSLVSGGRVSSLVLVSRNKLDLALPAPTTSPKQDTTSPKASNSNCH